MKKGAALTRCTERGEKQSRDAGPEQHHPLAMGSIPMSLARRARSFVSPSSFTSPLPSFTSPLPPPRTPPSSLCPSQPGQLSLPLGPFVAAVSLAPGMQLCLRS